MPVNMVRADRALQYLNSIAVSGQALVISVGRFDRRIGETAVQ